MWKSVRFAGAVAMAAILLSGCGDDATSPQSGFSGAPTGGLHVVAEDISFTERGYEAVSGSIDITYDNAGSIKHTLVVEGVDDLKLTVRARGDQDRGTVDLDAGEYTIFCDVPGHRQAGMEATLTVS